MSEPKENPRAARDTTAALAAHEVDPRLLVEEHGVRGYWQLFRRRMTSGDLGAFPVVVGLIVIWVYFQSQNDNFLSPGNITNLGLQLAATGCIAVGVVMVLLLGEIDLSVGVVSGVCASAMAVLSVNKGWGATEAIVAALVIGCLIGALQGGILVRFGVPSFVVTLAGLIAWQGVQLKVLGDEGTINIPFEGGIADLANTFLSDALGWTVVVVGVALYAAAQLWEVRTRRAAGLRPRPTVEVVARTLVLGVPAVLAVYWFNRDRGLPLSVLIFVMFVVIFDLVIFKTRYGRSVLATGGNEEAARRAGIRVGWVRLSCFMIASTMAAVGGVLEASRSFSVTTSSGGNDTLLIAIAAAVIGGTSLFGGRGSARGALLGILVLASITNGLFLLSYTSADRFIITGVVLLIAVVLDALARRGRQTAGRA
jgi:D-xylose transport system permease protein